MENLDWTSGVLQLTLEFMVDDSSMPLWRIYFSNNLTSSTNHYTNSCFPSEIIIAFIALLHFKSVEGP